MVDLLYVLVGLGFFALCVLYVRGCDRLIRADEAPESRPETNAEDLVSGGVR